MGFHEVASESGLHLPGADITHHSPLALQLVEDGHLDHGAALSAQITAQRRGLPLVETLFACHGVSRRAIAQSLATLEHTVLIDPTVEPPNPALLPHFGASRAMRMGLLPWRRIAGRTIILAADPRHFDDAADELSGLFGPVRLALSTSDLIFEAIQTQAADSLVAAAETRVPAPYSSRDWHAGRAMQLTLAIAALLIACALLQPVFTFAVLCTIAVSVLILSSALKIAALLNAPVHDPDPADMAVPAHLPTISLLIPLHRERAIADHLICRLEAIDYPRELLDVCLVLEDGDATTRHAIGQAQIPTWMRTVLVPPGTIKTKPRALNYALDTARGSLIGVYDAEDAPATDQLQTVARHFANAAPDVACLQGRLDYYNPAANWLTRCFTLEYASWFRVILPGLARMGLVVPLGGTTLFFRRDILERLGGWDAHNVTEDADLGIRLARHGYRTEFVATVTEEEANGRTWPWVKQRARWLKGYAITYGVHMRSPRKLWRDLGPWQWAGVQLLIGGTLLQFLLAPLLWSFWLLPFGLPHPLHGVVPPWSLWALGGVFLASEGVNLTVAIIAARRAGKGWLAKWAPTLHFYFPLAVLAAYKGLLELTWKPFYWDKTAHGIFQPATPPPPRPPHPA